MRSESLASRAAVPTGTGTSRAACGHGILASSMAFCTACGQDNPEGAKFCAECGARLAVRARAPAEERKVVTSLFCDLVGFTASSEQADPEDVDRMLAAYAAMAQTEIEAHGGVMEKFIGDAVVGVFGAPVTHEDDPERAVRAALRIAERAPELAGIDGAPLLLRVGINTGEALVRLGARAGLGERLLAGDAINTASRIQSIAPQMGVAVGLATYEATAVVFEYEELAPAVLKGKSEPVRVFHAKASRARFGTDLTRRRDGPFVGREIDLAILKGVFDKSVAAASAQLVTVVGEPGLGKSRLVAELLGFVDDRPELVTWRQGRCLPYGEGITFWALGEILKAHTGILESDAPAVASEKLEVVLPEGPEREWFRQRLLPLLGIEATSSAEREELFTAWRRFLESIAERGPTVLVFEDLHWADEALLAFLEHLADFAEGVPLLLVGTARPELFETHPDYARGLRNATPINLAPLSQEETARLVSALLDATVLPVEVQRAILERAGGNPLYTEEFVRLLKDRDLLVRNGPSWELREGAVVPLPESVQALIAARLDTLEADAKSLLADAAVVGKVFWAGAVAAMGDRDLQQVIGTLRELSRKELVRAERRSSMEGEAEYAFWHILARDVAYGQLPRASRASRHLAAAAWIESKAHGRDEDLADVLAYHYATALDLARAAGQTEQAAGIEAPARRFLGLAGERALGLDTGAALASFERALDLTPAAHPDRGHALARFGHAALEAGRYGDAVEALEAAIGLLRAGDDPRAAAKPMSMLAIALRAVGEPRGMQLRAQVVAMLEPLGPGPELVEALTGSAVLELIQGRYEPGLRYAEQALDLAAQLGLVRSARALGFRGAARAGLGDRGGLDDFREAIALATEAGQGREGAILHNNLAGSLVAYEGPIAVQPVYRAAIEFAQARGMTELVDLMTAGSIDLLFDSGEHEQALAQATASADRHRASGNVMCLTWSRTTQIRILILRGRAAETAPWLDSQETTCREDGDIENVVLGLGTIAAARAALGQHDAAATLLSEVEANPDSRPSQFYGTHLPTLVRTALTVAGPELADQLVAGVEPRLPVTEHALVAVGAMLAEARGELQAAAEGYAQAAQRWQQFGVVPEQAYALLGQGRCLPSLARSAEATQALEQARAIFEPLAAAPALAEIARLLHQDGALTA
jgi:class 3 adenylate cyclase/tetratricopeptide (TPR) repeat protein